MKTLFILIILCVPVASFGQTTKEKAITNFESFFLHFKNAYPADHNTYTFTNYSDLQNRMDVPEELEMMAHFDEVNFYNSYLYHIRHFNDTLINIMELNLNQNIKDTYAAFKQSILDGEKKGTFNYKKDKLYSEKLKTYLKDIEPPQIGYFQTVTVISRSPDNKVEESELFIIFNNNLQTVSMGTIEK